MKTLKEIGTPWAEADRGAYTLTGTLATEPQCDAYGEALPNWIYVGDMTEAAFWARFDWELHDNAHSISNPDWHCEHCQRAGWIEAWAQEHTVSVEPWPAPEAVEVDAEILRKLRDGSFDD